MTRCVIVDESSVVRKVAKRILTTPQDTVHESDNGQGALANLKSSAPDIIFVDADLPDMALTDFVSQVRAFCRAHQPTIIVMMTEMDLVRMTKAKRAGADNYLLKPFNREQLTRRVEEFRQAA